MTFTKLSFGSVLLVLLAAPIAAFVACDDETASAPTDYSSTLAAVSNDVFVPSYTSFAARADDLSASAGALATSPTADALAKTQAAWRAARAAFRSLDVSHFGPAIDLTVAEKIDVSPSSPGDIDAMISGTAPIDANAIGAATGKTKGFLGIEYVLFAGEGAATLARLSDGTAGTRRRAFVKAAANDIASMAHQLGDTWTKPGGFASELVRAGAGSSHYPTQRAAVDELVGGVGYALELVVGVRLAEPLGQKSGGAPDPKQDPTTASDSTVADLTATLGAVKAVYGQLSERVRAKTPALDDKVNQELADCMAKVLAIPAPFATTLTQNTAVVQAAYDSCKELKATWNADLTSAVGATLKPGDTDGD